MSVGIIGAGLFGQVIAAELRHLGHEVRVLDARHPTAGSRPSACLMKPSWFGSMRREDTEHSLELLDRHFGVQELNFRVGPMHTSVKWVQPSRVLAGPSEELHVVKIRQIDDGFLVFATPNDSLNLGAVAVSFRFSHLVVAAGRWTNELVEGVPPVEGKAGISFFWSNQRIAENFIIPWAPYKQVVALQMPGGVWVGDGSAINAGNWTHEREAATLARCARLAGLPPEEARGTYGVRPYVNKKFLGGDPCYLREHAPGLWVATGGAKNGTVAAGWAAHRLGRVLS